MRRLVLIALALFLVVPVAHAQDEDTLRDRIGAGKSREQSLASAADRLGELERKAGREVTLLEGLRGVAPGQSLVVYDGTQVLGQATVTASRRASVAAR